MKRCQKGGAGAGGAAGAAGASARAAPSVSAAASVSWAARAREAVATRNVYSPTPCTPERILAGFCRHSSAAPLGSLYLPFLSF